VEGVVSLARRKSGIFISYRRDQAANAGRLYDHLSKRFGEDRVFYDVDSIVAGDDFSKEIISKVSQCGVMLVLIGPDWLGTAAVTRRRRIDKPNDWVRLEIETALRQGIWVVPVLVDGVKMPKASDLPRSLRPFARRHAFELSNIGFPREAGLLIQAVEQGYKVPQEEWRLNLQSNDGSKSTFRLSSDNREHLITISLTNRGKSVINVDGQVVATGLTSAGVTGQEIRLEALSRVFGPVATIKVDILNPATSYLENTVTCYRIVLEIDDQVLEYETQEYDRARERRLQNQLRRKRASDAVWNVLESDAFKGFLRDFNDLLREINDLLKSRHSERHHS